MKKVLLFFSGLLSFAISASAQVNTTNVSGTAQQSVQLGLSNALELTFTSNNTANGSTVTMSFTTADNYANGVESGAQELKIRSNKNFKVAAKIDLSTFSYVGSGNIYNMVTPADAFTLKVITNTTGGTIASTFSSYGNLTTSDQDVILNGVKGNDQRFSVKYKSNPGWGMPAGTYNFAVVYTATQQ